MKKLITGSKLSKLSMVFMCAALIAACGNTSEAQTNDETASTTTTAAKSTVATEGQQTSIKMSDLVTFDEKDQSTDWSAENPVLIQLEGTSASIEGSGAEAKDGSVMITAAGTYVLSGKLTEGQVVVDVQDEGNVRLVLNGVDIHDSDSAPIYVKEAKNAMITLIAGTENVVTDGKTYVLADDSTDEPNAAIFSKSDLTINGTGKLSVLANYNNGITSKDDLKIREGTIEVQAADDGILGRDMVAVADGKITIVAAGDGIKATNDTDAAKGFIAIAGGTFDVKAGADGIQAETTVLIDGGTYTMVTGGGNENGEVKVEERGQGGPWGGDTAQSSTDTEIESEETESQSAKGVKATGNIVVNNGTFTIDSADDAIHSNGSVVVSGGELAIASGDDGLHAGTSLTISGGQVDITKSYEGIEGSVITISGGETHVVASDDGTNAAGGTNNLLNITGGYLTVNSLGDGLDSNGSLSMSGGTVVVSGPTGNGNGTLDYDGTFEMTGGTLAAAGSSGMAQAPSNDSSQFSLLMSFPQTQKAGTLVHLEDSEGNNIMTFAPAKDYQTIVISSPNLKKAGSYTLYSRGTSTGSEVSGYYADGEYSGGTKVIDFEITTSVTWLNESGVTAAQSNNFGGGGGGGRSKGVRPDGAAPEGDSSM
ncbi:carbohydrate-binding domain-containing protein [Paenibacillus wynnii]|uniref:Dockerin type 1 n=1 Tax=Paenibacillus wynnii TaxID=268407 RepID=A0A098MC67_9BACL|nr:carbohydrate-binding domain-containing protein [Paenibacillus wynnii]KGE20145.1 dockerin type 1 [Paenibacillus wynnii]